MKKHVRKLAEISEKSSRLIVGLMSGTSLDGLDVALCEVSGAGPATEVRLLEFETMPYGDDTKKRIREVFAKDTVDFQLLTILNPWLGSLHADYVSRCLDKWNVSPGEVDLIASHGQTVLHAPKRLHGYKEFPNGTLQIGDGDHLAYNTGIITISDFRQKHAAAGGEGAPLSLYGDFLLFSSEREDRILLNCGGIANFTYLPKSLDATQAFATDTGPGNTLIDAFTRELYPGYDYDKDSLFAKSGSVHREFLKALKSHPFFLEGFPKTTGPELFSKEYVRRFQIEAGAEGVSSEDILATLTRFSAETIAEAIGSLQGEFPFTEGRIYFSGGGAHNPLLVEQLKELLKKPLCSVDTLSVSGDAKEAVLFAVLANETIAGTGVDFGRGREVPSVSMGKISFPC